MPQRVKGIFHSFSLSQIRRLITNCLTTDISKANFGPKMAAISDNNHPMPKLPFPKPSFPDSTKMPTPIIPPPFPDFPLFPDKPSFPDSTTIPPPFPDSTIVPPPFPDSAIIPPPFPDFHKFPDPPILQFPDSTSSLKMTPSSNSNSKSKNGSNANSGRKKKVYVALTTMKKKSRPSKISTPPKRKFRRLGDIREVDPKYFFVGN